MPADGSNPSPKGGRANTNEPGAFLDGNSGLKPLNGINKLVFMTGDRFVEMLASGKGISEGRREPQIAIYDLFVCSMLIYFPYCSYYFVRDI
jgi:hypothetical protein